MIFQHVLGPKKYPRTNLRILPDHKWSADRSLGNTALHERTRLLIFFNLFQPFTTRHGQWTFTTLDSINNVQLQIKCISALKWTKKMIGKKTTLLIYSPMDGMIVQIVSRIVCRLNILLGNFQSFNGIFFCYIKYRWS